MLIPEEAREIQRRVHEGSAALRLMTNLDPDLKTVRVIVSPEMYARAGVSQIGGLAIEPDPCLSLGQMRFRVEAVL